MPGKTANAKRRIKDLIVRKDAGWTEYGIGANSVNENYTCLIGKVV